MKNQLRGFSPLIAVCVIGIPRAAFGAAEDENKPKFDPNSPPLHGNPNPGNTGLGEKRDESDLAKNAIRTTASVTEVGGDTSEITALLARAKEIKDGNSMPRHDIVEIRMNLQRFRGQSDNHAAAVDAEINRLEALLLDMEVPKGKPNITGQTRNLPSKR